MPADGGGGPAALQALLALSDEELCAVLDLSPLELLSGEHAARPETAILLDLLAEAQEAVGEAQLRRWLRTEGPEGTPLAHLLARDFVRFEDALAALEQRGFVIRGGGPEHASS